MTTAAQVIDRTLRHLLTGQREQRNTLNGDVTDSATSFIFAYDLKAIKEGARISVGLEDCYVWATNEGSKTATVERGDFGTDAAAHTSGAMVTVNPKFSRAEVLQAINDELAALSADGLFRIRNLDIDYQAARTGYAVTVTDLLTVQEVRYKLTGSESNWPEITNWSLARDMDTDEFASGVALFLYSGAQPGQPVRVTYRASFTALTGEADNVETVSGLHTEAHDILPLGAAIRLAAGREIKRNFDEHQGDTRRAEEVPPGANLSAPRALMMLHQERVRHEQARLIQRWGVLR